MPVIGAGGSLTEAKVSNFEGIVTCLSYTLFVYINDYFVIINSLSNLTIH